MENVVKVMAVWVWVLLLMMNSGDLVVMGDTSDCDAVVAEVVDLCRDYVVGTEPPSPGLNSPCCKSLRRNQGSLSCLCGRVDFAALNQRNLFFTSTICLIHPLECA